MSYTYTSWDFTICIKTARYVEFFPTSNQQKNKYLYLLLVFLITIKSWYLIVIAFIRKMLRSILYFEYKNEINISRLFMQFRTEWMTCWKFTEYNYIYRSCLDTILNFLENTLRGHHNIRSATMCAHDTYQNIFDKRLHLSPRRWVIKNGKNLKAHE